MRTKDIGNLNIWSYLVPSVVQSRSCTVYFCFLLGHLPDHVFNLGAKVTAR